MKIKRTGYYSKLSRDEQYMFNVAGSVGVWDLGGERPLEKYRFTTLRNPIKLAVSSDEKKLVFSNTSGHLVLADLQTGEVMTKTRGTKQEGGNVFFIQDDTKVLSSDWEGRVFTWDFCTGEIEVIEQLPVFVAVIFSSCPNDKVIITGSDKNNRKGNGHFRIWEMKTKEHLEPKEILLNERYRGTTRAIDVVKENCYFYNEEGKKGVIYVLDLLSKEVKPLMTITLIDDRFHPDVLRISMDEKYMLVGFSEEVMAYDLSTKKYIGSRYYKTQGNMVYCVSDLNFFDQNKKILVSTWSSIESLDFPACFNED